MFYESDVNRNLFLFFAEKGLSGKIPSEAITNFLNSIVEKYGVESLVKLKNYGNPFIMKYIEDELYSVILKGTDQDLKDFKQKKSDEKDEEDFDYESFSSDVQIVLNKLSWNQKRISKFTRVSFENMSGKGLEILNWFQEFHMNKVFIPYSYETPKGRITRGNIIYLLSDIFRKLIPDVEWSDDFITNFVGYIYYNIENQIEFSGEGCIRSIISQLCEMYVEQTKKEEQKKPTNKEKKEETEDTKEKEIKKKSNLEDVPSTVNTSMLDDMFDSVKNKKGGDKEKETKEKKGKETKEKKGKETKEKKGKETKEKKEKETKEKKPTKSGSLKSGVVAKSGSSRKSSEDEIINDPNFEVMVYENATSEKYLDDVDDSDRKDEMISFFTKEFKDFDINDYEDQYDLDTVIEKKIASVYPKFGIDIFSLIKIEYSDEYDNSKFWWIRCVRSLFDCLSNKKIELDESSVVSNMEFVKEISKGKFAKKGVYLKFSDKTYVYKLKGENIIGRWNEKEGDEEKVFKLTKKEFYLFREKGSHIEELVEEGMEE